jgi:formylglycine-generating enzyme
MAAEDPSAAGMVFILGGVFRMGSHSHYPEEAPAHEVAVGRFWIDRMSVTNRDFLEFVNATGYVTFAELNPDPKDHPGAPSAKHRSAWTVANMKTDRNTIFPFQKR